MEAIQCLRNVRVLARLVLTLYVLTIGVAIAAPLVHDDPLTLLCTAAGGVKLVQVDTDDDTPRTETHLLDCVMCLTSTLPPETARVPVFLDFDNERYFSPVARLRSQTPVTACARDPPSVS